MSDVRCFKREWMGLTAEEIGAASQRDGCQLLYDSVSWLSGLRVEAAPYLRRKLIRCWFDEIMERTTLQHLQLGPQEVEANPARMADLTQKHDAWLDIDALARGNRWWRSTSDKRVDFCTKWIIMSLCSDDGGGHSFVDLTVLATDWERRLERELSLELPPDPEGALCRLRDACEIWVTTHDGKRVVGPKKYYDQDSSIASGVALLLERDVFEHDYVSDDPSEFEPTHEQLAAINGVINSPLCVVTGDGGTGKTSCVAARAISFIEKEGNGFLLLAPTHDAKKNALKEVMQNADLGYEHPCFQTIQSYTFPYKDRRTGKNTCRLERYIDELGGYGLLYIFVEESSMVDRTSFSRLLDVCSQRSGTRITLLGGVDQLPPVGAGQPFQDIIRYSAVPVHQLTKNFRSRGSDIPKFCDMIRGMGPSGSWWSGEDLRKFENVHCHFSSPDPSTIKSVMLSYKGKGYRPYGLNFSADDKSIQIISNTNATCKLLLPLVREVFWEELGFENSGSVPDSVYAKNDPVLLKDNNSIFNNGDNAVVVGTVGRGAYPKYLLRLRHHCGTGTPSDNSKYCYHQDEESGDAFVTVPEDGIKPALVRTVHSSQGRGFGVGLYVLGSNWYMNMNMHYTAYSRAKKQLHLFGPRYYFCDDKSRTAVPRRNSYVPSLLTE